MLRNDTSGDFVSQLFAIRRNREITEFTVSFIPQSIGRLNHRGGQKYSVVHAWDVSTARRVRAESSSKNSVFLYVLWCFGKHIL